MKSQLGLTAENEFIDTQNAITDKASIDLLNKYIDFLVFCVSCCILSVYKFVLGRQTDLELHIW